jgi:phosphate transport system protein
MIIWLRLINTLEVKKMANHGGARKTFHERLKELDNEVLRMGSKVNQAVDRAVQALYDRDMDLADEVMEGDDEIDQLNVTIEESAITLIARQCPVAGDLRLLTSILRVTLHLERIGDLAVNIAQLAKMIIQSSGKPGRKDIIELIEEMRVSVKSVLSKALKAFADRDKKLAKELHRLDDPIDDLNRRFLKKLAEYRDEEDFDWIVDMVLISRWLERVADQAVDIGDQVRFLVTGEIVE